MIIQSIHYWSTYNLHSILAFAIKCFILQLFLFPYMLLMLLWQPNMLVAYNVSPPFKPTGSCIFTFIAFPKHYTFCSTNLKSAVIQFSLFCDHLVENLGWRAVKWQLYTWEISDKSPAFPKSLSSVRSQAISYPYYFHIYTPYTW